ncbi:hypothetical protein TL16_g05712 [Triparma laevis f. inornata]|uniref:Ion transport domain-containing protein n=1 Tax=Triparma laevis f. inornata TaxID=1714386 RepID=A0A9W7EB62_9STRA|nr:hypothetical protein TL16_g05712 [Triparma laevis f. inornata]
MESVSNPLIEQVDSDSDSGIEMSEVEVETEVETAEVGREYEETILISDIIKADPDAKSWEGHLKVEHNEGLICQAVSHDERFVVAGGEVGHIYYIDKKKGSEVQKIKLVHDNNCEIKCLAFPPKTSEEESIVYAGIDEGFETAEGFESRPAKIYAVNLSTSEILHANTLEGHTDGINDLAVSPNGETLISVAQDSTTRIWEISKKGDCGKELKEINNNEGDRQNCVAFSHVDSYFFTGGDGHNIHIYDMAKDDCELLTKLEGHTDEITSLTSSPDDTKLFSGSYDYTIKIWDTSSSNAKEWTLLKTLVGHEGGISRLSLSPCSRYLASSNSDKTVKVWNVEAGILLRTIKSPKMTSVMGVSFGRDNTIYSSSTDGRVRTWNLAANGREKLKIEGHEEEANEVAVSSDGSTIISGHGEDDFGEVRVWDAQTGEEKACLEGHTSAVGSVAISKDAKLAISGSDDNTVRIWSLEGEGEELKKIGFGKWVKAVTFSSDEKSLFAGDSDGLLNQFSVDNGELIKEFKGHTKEICSLKTTSDGKHLISGSEDKTSIIWNVESGEKIRTLEGHIESVYTVDVTPDNSKIVSGSQDGTAKLWELETGKLIYTFDGHSNSVMSVSVHPSGGFIATGSWDNTWKLWSLDPPYTLLFTSRDSHTKTIMSVAFSPDGNSLISGSLDETINIADLVPCFNFLPNSIQDKTFKFDCDHEDESPKQIDWTDTATISCLQQNPHSLSEPQFDLNSRQTLIHLAAKNGRSNFLSAAIIVRDDGTEDDLEKGIVGWQTRQYIALSSATLSNDDGETPLALAVIAESGPTVKVLLECYALLLSQAYALPYTTDNSSQEQHPSSQFPLDELILTLSKFPQLALTFLFQLSLNTSGDHLVLDGVKRHEIGGSTGRLIEGSKSRIPQNFWSAKLNKTDENGKVAEEKGLPVTAKFVPIKDIAAPNSTFLLSVVEACSATKKYTVFENEVIQTVVEHKWKTYVEEMFFFHLYLDIAMVFFLTVDALTYKTVMASDTHNIIKIVGHLPMFITLTLWSFFARHEYNQWASTSASTTLEKIKSTLAISGTIVLGIFSNLSTAEGVGVGGVSFHSSTLAMAFALPLSYLNTLFYMQGSKESGELVRMIIGIIQGIRVFLAILIVCMIGFAASFFVLFEGQSNEDGDSTHIGPPQTLLWSYTVMLAGFGVGDLEGSASFFSTSMLFIAFTIFINIIMLNLLIAIMGDIFDKIQENAKAEFIFARANIILEFEGTLNEEQRKNKEWFPTWLQVLVPTLDSDGVDEGDWVGKVRSLKKSFNKVSDKLDASEKARKEERRENWKKDTKKEQERKNEMKLLEKKLEDAEKQREESEKKREEDVKRLEGILSDLKSLMLKSTAAAAGVPTATTTSTTILSTDK